MNIAVLLSNTARRAPEARAVSDFSPAAEAAAWTYREFQQRVALTAGWLRRQPGVVAGDRVALAMSNTASFLQMLFGCWHAGLCAVPMNAKLHAREFVYMLEDAQARLCLATPALFDEIEAELRVGELRAAEPHDGQPQAPVGENHATRLRAGLHRVDAELLSTIDQGAPITMADVQADAPAWLFYTSGTTGRPKGATLSHRNLMFCSLAYYADIDALDTDDTIVHAAPLSHGSGLYALPHIGRGSHNLVLDHFSVDAMFEVIGSFPNVSFFAAPTMLVRMLNDSRVATTPMANLKTIVYGGAPMYVADLRRAFEFFGARMYQLYGQGESPMTITGLDQRQHAAALAADDPRRLASCGYPRTGVEVRIVDDDGVERPIGEVGEIITRSDARMIGYWGNEQATRSAVRDGWLYTGDLGSMDADGLLTLKDRSKDLVISGGSNIYPREVEDVLLAHPQVVQAAVIGVPHPDWGEELVAFVVGHPTSLDAAALDAWCLTQIARFKRPKRYVFVEDLPKNSYGKVLKNELRRQATIIAR